MRCVSNSVFLEWSHHREQYFRSGALIPLPQNGILLAIAAGATLAGLWVVVTYPPSARCTALGIQVRESPYHARVHKAMKRWLRERLVSLLGSLNPEEASESDPEALRAYLRRRLAQCEQDEQTLNTMVSLSTSSKRTMELMPTKRPCFHRHLASHAADRRDYVRREIVGLRARLNTLDARSGSDTV